MTNVHALRDYVPRIEASAARGYLTSRSTRDCRLHATERTVIRVKAPVGVTGGYVKDAFPPAKRESKNARRKRQRYGK